MRRRTFLFITVIIYVSFILAIVCTFIAKPSSEVQSTSNSITTFDKPVGVWAPFSDNYRNLEELEGVNQSEAISNILAQGFDEYYFVMSDFENPKLVDSTETLLQSTENLDHSLKIIIIVLPPSEGGSIGNYDWRGWIEYFNSLKQRYPNSFEGFTIDDFNWISTRNDTKFEHNIDFMEYSNLVDALKHKRKDVKFFPTVYFEGVKTDVVVNKFLNYIDGVIAVSGCYYNISALEPQLHLFGELFDNKPMKYVVYPTITHNYSRQHYSPPSDQLVISTLSIASRIVDGIIIWHKINGSVIQEYSDNTSNNNRVDIDKMNSIKRVQIEDEHAAWVVYNESNITSKSNKSNITSNGREMNCLEWHNKYLHAYNYWLTSNSVPDEVDLLKRKLFSFINQ
jgi:hypothetical protein